MTLYYYWSHNLYEYCEKQIYKSKTNTVLIKTM